MLGDTCININSGAQLCPGSSVHWDSADDSTGVSSHFLLQEIFPTQGSNLALLHCGQTLPSEPESACNAAVPGSIPGSGRSPGGGRSNPLQYSCLENPMDRGARGRKESDITERLRTEHQDLGGNAWKQLSDQRLVFRACEELL